MMLLQVENGSRHKEACRILTGTIRGIRCGFPSRENMKAGTIAGLPYSTASVTKWPTRSPSATASAKSASLWTSGFGSFSTTSSINFNSYSP